MNHAARKHCAQQTENDFGKKFRLKSVSQCDRFQIGDGRQREYEQPGSNETAKNRIELGGGKEGSIHLHGRKEQHREHGRQHQRNYAGNG